jgi:hypothetical protein
MGKNFRAKKLFLEGFLALFVKNIFMGNFKSVSLFPFSTAFLYV